MTTHAHNITMLRAFSSSSVTVRGIKNVRVRFLQTTIQRLSQSSATKSVTVRNGRLHYQLRGSGSHVILCLPGALGTALTDVHPQLEYFGREGSGYTVVGIDPLGYGASRPPEREFQVEPDHFLKIDALDSHVLMQALSFKKFSVLGWSDGGVSAIILAALFPDSVEKLVVWGSNAYVTKEDIELFEKTRDITNWSQRMREPMENLYGDFFQSLWSNWVDAMRAIYKRRESGDLCLEEVKQVQCPTLIFHGAKDAMCPQFHADYLKEKIKDSKMVVMSEGKHNLHLKYAQEFNRLVDTFLSTNQKI